MNYLARQGLAVEPGLLVIPNKHHFFYDMEDMKGVKTIINLMRLNHVREVRDFVRKISELVQYQQISLDVLLTTKLKNGHLIKPGTPRASPGNDRDI